MNARALLAGVIACMALVIPATATSTARAATWMQISCVNPNGSAAPSEGWSDGSSGSGAPITSTQCGPGTPMQAELSDLAPAPANATTYLEYEPPAGSALDGGELNVNLSAYGYGTSGSTYSAAAYARLYEPGLSDVFFQCVAFFQTCGSSPQYSGEVSLPSDAGGLFYGVAGCQSGTGTACDANALDGAWALVQIASAHLLLDSNQSPQGTGFSGSALQSRTRGTAHLVFTAQESSGPGIYFVTVDLDGRSVWSGTPNTNGGECVPVGTDPATGALMFDHEQPCLDSEVVDVPVPTAGLPDGSHELAVTVTDAARNSSTVLDQRITTYNPQRTPRPRRGTVAARFVISWTWNGARTTLRSITASSLPRTGHITIGCLGRHCPTLKIRNASARHAGPLLRGLARRRLAAGDRLEITVTAPRRRAEHIELDIRDGQEPRARLLKR